MARARLFPFFWTALFAVALALNVLEMGAHDADRLQGLSGAGLAVLLVLAFGLNAWLSVVLLYRPEPRRWRRAVAGVAALLVLMALLVRGYDPNFGWLGLTVVSLVVGGLPRRAWPFPLVGVGLILLLGALPAPGGAFNLGYAVGGLLLLAVWFGLALFIRAIQAQRDQLRAALDQLEQANAELARRAGQQQELAVLRERARMARALHDHLGRALVVMNVKLAAAQLLYARDAPGADLADGNAELEATRGLIRETMTELRRALADLRGVAGRGDDLPTALGQLAGEVQQRSGITVFVNISAGLPQPPPAAREALWYVGREALANVERHAAAATATVSLDCDSEGWQLRVEDDGVGMAEANLDRAQHFGLLGMRERMQALGGMLRVERGRAGGTLIVASLPVRPKLEGSPS